MRLNAERLEFFAKAAVQKLHDMTAVKAAVLGSKLVLVLIHEVQRLRAVEAAAREMLKPPNERHWGAVRDLRDALDTLDALGSIDAEELEDISREIH
jgi:hypothetical protein